MWRDVAKNRKTNNKQDHHRLQLVLAVVFLLLGALAYRLFIVQIRDGDLYTALAANQQQIFNRLKPERGRILFGNKMPGEKGDYYPLATNKDFALLYAVPKDIKEPRPLAEKLFAFFDQPLLEKEAGIKLADNSKAILEKKIQEIQSDANLSDTDKTQKISALVEEQASYLKSASSSEAQNSEKQKAVEARREEIINGYLKRLDKPGDPYELLVKKMPMEELIKFYAEMSSAEGVSTSPADLDISQEKVIRRDGTEVKITGLGYEFQKYRFYPEGEMGANLSGFVSYNDEEGNGRYGLEEYFNKELAGQYGSLKAERGVGKNMLIINNREYVKPQNGSDLLLTVDRNIEYFTCDRLKTAVDKFQASGGTAIMMDPKTGAIIAMCSYPSFDPNDYKNVKDIKYFNNPAIFYQYEPGSVFKTITISASIDQGKISPSTTYKDPGEIYINGWPKPIRNSDFSTKGAHGVVDMNFVLENSLNTGSIFAMRQAGAKIFSEYVKNYGFGEKTGIEFGLEASGDIGKLLKGKIKDIDSATASFGQGISVTPLQMVASYAALANKGVLMRPYVVQSVIDENGNQVETKPKAVRQVVSEKTAGTILAMLTNVVEKGHSKKAYIDGYYIGGKTGTAQSATNGGYSTQDYIHTFIGIAPIENPRFVLLTKIDNPQGVQYAEGSVVPLWREIADYTLNYYQVPKTRK